MTIATPRATETGGRAATTRHIPPKLALAVGMPSTKAPEGWRWTALTELARLESGHTPSRRHPEYWGGDIPWISLADAKLHHGARIEQTIETTNALGIENSSARVLPSDTVCLSRTASVGYVLVTGCPMATSQDFVNWVCSRSLDAKFLQYLFIAEGDDLLRFASGAVHNTIYFPEVKAFHICHPPIAEQKRIVAILDRALREVATAKANTEKNLENVRMLFERELQTVFAQRGQGWLDTTLGQLAKIQSGTGFPKTFQGKVDGGMPFYKVSDMNLPGNEREMVYENNSITEAVRRELGASVFPKGSVIFPKIGGAIATNKKRLTSQDCCVDNNVMGAIPNPRRITSDFLSISFFLPIGSAILPTTRIFHR